MPEPQSQEKTATPRLSTSTAECFHVVLASVLLLTFATASVLAVKFSYMSCVPDFRGSPEAGTCPSLLNGNAIQNTTTEELYKSKGCSVVAGCTAFEHPILQIAVPNADEPPIVRWTVIPAESAVKISDEARRTISRETIAENSGRRFDTSKLQFLV